MEKKRMGAKGIEGMEVKGMEVKGMEVKGMEVKGMEIEGMEIEGMEVKGMQVKGTEGYRGLGLWDRGMGVEERLDCLIGELTVEEKIGCLTTGCPDVERLGIKGNYMGGEAAHGIEARHDQAFNRGEAEATTCLTQPVGMCASFDRELIGECGRVVGEEARALFNRNGGGGLCRWAPTVDMARDPRWGRTEEAYGEDPYLAGEMASGYIRGMKGEDGFYLQCGATLKHFYGNNVEKDRTRVSSSLDGRNKYEYYLEPFRKAIAEGQAEAVMTSYNEINGVPAIVNDEVQKLLKDKWGLPGHVVCDGGDFQQTVTDHGYFGSHAETLAAGLKAGVDCFTDDGEVVMAAAREALAQGLIGMEDIDRSVRNSFRTRIRLGFFDSEGECPYSRMGEEYVNSKEHQEIAGRMAREAVVLLKNEGQMLPLLPEGIRSLAVIGPLADVWYKDWYCGIPPYAVTVLEGVKKVYGRAEIRYEDGLLDVYISCGDRYVGLDEEGRLCLTDIGGRELFRYTDWGIGSGTLYAAGRGKYVTLTAEDLRIVAGSDEVFSWFIRESWDFQWEPDGSLRISSWNGRKVAIDEQGYLGVILTDERMVGEDDSLLLKTGGIWEGEAAVFGLEVVRDGLALAAEAAQQAEKAVLVLGCNPVINSKEEVDRTTLALPPMQQQLADRVLAANPDTVVVLISNYPYSICELDEKAPAILWSASGSQELGNGIAAILSGQEAPAGRLNMTWLRRDEDLPDMNDYDIIKGKRTYQYFDGKVLYPFGYGLGYTRFEYRGLQLKRAEHGIVIGMSVTNVGEVVSDEVVQLYYRIVRSRVKRPLLKLCGFERLKAIAPGETRAVEMVVPLSDLCYYDVISQKMLLEEGEYIFMAGASSADIRQQEGIFIEGEKVGFRNPYQDTAADCYDEYQDCYIHKGTAGYTCIIPGRPGDNGDVLNLNYDEQELPTACVWYRDFVFDRPAAVLVLTVNCGGQGWLEVEAQGSDSLVKGIKTAVGKTEGFMDIRVGLPEDFAAAGSNRTICLKLIGGIKLCKFRFE